MDRLRGYAGGAGNRTDEMQAARQDRNRRLGALKVTDHSVPTSDASRLGAGVGIVDIVACPALGLSEVHLMSGPDLGGYAKPPVVEVVAAVRFSDLPVVLSAGLGEFWRSKLASDLPDVAVKAPYSAPVEAFARTLNVPEFSLDLTEVPPFPRFWFTAASGDELLQLQSNWMACNWRKVAPEAVYGRWRSRRDAFQVRFGQLSAWVEDRGGHIIPDQCEVTYINHIYPMDGIWQVHAEAHRVFTLLNSLQSPPPVRAEHEILQASYIISSQGEPIGRVHVKVQPAFSLKDDTPIFVMELTARGAPRAPSLDSVLDFLDQGRQAVVTIFDSITTPEVQEGWGKE